MVTNFLQICINQKVTGAYKTQQADSRRTVNEIDVYLLHLKETSSSVLKFTLRYFSLFKRKNKTSILASALCIFNILETF